MENEITVEEEVGLVNAIAYNDNTFKGAILPTLKLKGFYLESYGFSVGTKVDVEIDVGIITLTARN